jgi:hypothetical protein
MIRVLGEKRAAVEETANRFGVTLGARERIMRSRLFGNSGVGKYCIEVKC